MTESVSKNEFDVIITDSSDPVGPAESLFGASYYELLRDALREGGILSSQGECPWLDLALIGRVISQASGLFPVVRYACGSVPTYTSGLMGYILAGKNKVQKFLLNGESSWLHLELIAHMVQFNRKLFRTVRYAQSAVSTYPSGTMGYLLCAKADSDLSKPCRILSDEQLDAWNLRFYNPQVHEAAFALPQFVRKALQEK
ncbi:hypothetical protein WR25_20559 [Diploscapter pachys]|uniref:PABS domain-containing protein n=1 Tax=Diploscapter pachys TaxID=2018661 RepID=A0A2A2JSR3_9BILA|nr:hypothetical protein WR25_20559 [Diploscapter pachys]